MLCLILIMAAFTQPEELDESIIYEDRFTKTVLVKIAQFLNRYYLRHAFYRLTCNNCGHSAYTLCNESPSIPVFQLKRTARNAPSR
ncbi:MAG TPA: hypothetical protein PK669_12850 [Methanosarcina thermophila]|uniref:Uncharacterized protein n=2 Tax=Methanosarcina thermophila TaxID=2210 RepID=A0A0E3KSE3_METTE|nr:hypothetical protein [Methanosarcina thermophila]AKB16793.1 hypothetical protein MSTHC_2475 [Methanosarcina thermophila CHTI-55]HOA70042.1 hypothetical protein [Methanosarcina thermophila]HOQ66809.1 hypothetical protein [Methanosarcina thermophila]HPT81950.1 hypothetical protein [Methanosarcina thermophila]HPZ21198.1 hypothetical protein [Methanosarcina thermophila]